MSKSKVIVAYLGRPSVEFDGDSLYCGQYGVTVRDGKTIVGYAGSLRGRLPSHAYVVKPKKWKLKFIKE